MANSPRLLVCPPVHYRVAYEINPWMNLHRQPHPALARQQWQDLRSQLKTLADPVEIAPVCGAPDMVFTANAGFAREKRVVVSRFRHAERRIEESFFHQWFEQAGFEIVDWPPNLCFEGEGDALRQPGDERIWFGYGIRSDYAAAFRLQRAFAAEVIPLRLVSPRFYHLDTCFCPLPHGAVMYYPEALAAESRMQLYSRVPAHLRIPVDAKDAQLFACNALLLGSTLILNRASTTLCQRLACLGLNVKQCPVSEFIRAGGAVKCLTLRLD